MVDGIGVGNEEFNECKFDVYESVVVIEKLWMEIVIVFSLER